jgi:large subunit ribosomal protein L10
VPAEEEDIKRYVLLSPCAGTRTYFLPANLDSGIPKGVNEMPTEKKQNIITSLEQNFAQCDSGIMTDYRGLKTPDIVALRRKLRENGVEFHVVKNKLARVAANHKGKDQIASIFKGPMAVVFVKNDISKAAKILTGHITAFKLALTIRGGFLGNKLLTPKEVSTIATLPSREVLLGKVMGGVQGPLYALMNQVNAPLRGLMTVLQERMKQLEGVK